MTKDEWVLGENRCRGRTSSENLRCREPVRIKKEWKVEQPSYDTGPPADDLSQIGPATTHLFVAGIKVGTKKLRRRELSSLSTPLQDEPQWYTKDAVPSRNGLSPKKNEWMSN